MKMVILTLMLLPVLVLFLSFAKVAAESDEIMTHRQYTRIIEREVKSPRKKPVMVNDRRAISMVLGEMQDMEFVHLSLEDSLFEAVKDSGKADCKGRAIYSLCRLVQLGFPIKDLGFALYLSKTDKPGHIEPLVFQHGTSTLLNGEDAADYFREAIEIMSSFSVYRFEHGTEYRRSPLKRGIDEAFRNLE